MEAFVSFASAEEGRYVLFSCKIIQALNQIRMDMTWLQQSLQFPVEELQCELELVRGWMSKSQQSPLLSSTALLLSDEPNLIVKTEDEAGKKKSRQTN